MRPANRIHRTSRDVCSTLDINVTITRIALTNTGGSRPTNYLSWRFRWPTRGPLEKDHNTRRANIFVTQRRSGAGAGLRIDQISLAAARCRGDACVAHRRARRRLAPANRRNGLNRRGASHQPRRDNGQGGLYVAGLPDSEGLFSPRWSPGQRYIADRRAGPETLLHFDFVTPKYSRRGGTRHGLPLQAIENPTNSGIKLQRQ